MTEPTICKCGERKIPVGGFMVCLSVVGHTDLYERVVYLQQKLDDARQAQIFCLEAFNILKKKVKRQRAIIDEMKEIIETVEPGKTGPLGN